LSWRNQRRLYDQLNYKGSQVRGNKKAHQNQLFLSSTFIGDVQRRKS
jgi:hypothetical protein